MRTLINYIRSCFCEHEWELLAESAISEFSMFAGKEVICGKVWVYRCKKCCASKKISARG